MALLKNLLISFLLLSSFNIGLKSIGAEPVRKLNVKDSDCGDSIKNKTPVATTSKPCHTTQTQTQCQEKKKEGSSSATKPFTPLPKKEQGLKCKSSKPPCEEKLIAQCGCQRQQCRCKAVPPRPVKTTCENTDKCLQEKKEAPCCQELKTLKEEVSKGSTKSKVPTQGMFKMTKSDKNVEKELCLNRKDLRSITMATECEQCELQIKSTGDGIVLRCKICEKVHPENIPFPTTKPAKVVKIP